MWMSNWADLLYSVPSIHCHSYATLRAASTQASLPWQSDGYAAVEAGFRADRNQLAAISRTNERVDETSLSLDNTILGQFAGAAFCLTSHFILNSFLNTLDVHLDHLVGFRLRSRGKDDRIDTGYVICRGPASHSSLTEASGHLQVTTSQPRPDPGAEVSCLEQQTL